MTALTENINQIVCLTTQEKSTIEQAYSTIEIAKGDLWVQQGKICDQVGFVVSGKLRNFYIDESGNEVTCYFVAPENFISSFTSFLTNTPANENISALEDCVLRVISKKDLEELCESLPKMQLFSRASNTLQTLIILYFLYKLRVIDCKKIVDLTQLFHFLMK